MIGERGTDVVRVEYIGATQTKTPGVQQYTITARLLSAGRTLQLTSATVQYQTINPHLMKLLDWGKQSEWPLRVEWKRSAYGRDVVDVEKLDYQ